MASLNRVQLIGRLGADPKKTETNKGTVVSTFSIREFRASAFGYFGHQWEIYAFWTLVPALVVQSGLAEAGSRSLSGIAFLVIGVGATTLLSRRKGQ